MIKKGWIKLALLSYRDSIISILTKFDWHSGILKLWCSHKWPLMKIKDKAINGALLAVTSIKLKIQKRCITIKHWNLLCLPQPVGYLKNTKIITQYIFLAVAKRIWIWHYINTFEELSKAHNSDWSSEAIQWNLQ